MNKSQRIKLDNNTPFSNIKVTLQQDVESIDFLSIKNLN